MPKEKHRSVGAMYVVKGCGLCAGCTAQLGAARRYGQKKDRWDKANDERNGGLWQAGRQSTEVGHESLFGERRG
jgi:hypothetical protein